MKYNAVIFDFDGTLADTAHDVWKSVEYAAGKLGGRMDTEFMKNTENLGAPMADILKAVQPVQPGELLWQFQEDIKYHYRVLNLYEDTKLYPGIEKLLLRMERENILRFIVSAKPMGALERILHKKNWDVLFDAWYSQEELDGKKYTKAELIRKLLQNELKERYPVYIGDTYTDVIAARECKVDCIAAAYGDGSREKLLAEHPTHVIIQPSQLEAYF